MEPCGVDVVEEERRQIGFACDDPLRRSQHLDAVRPSGETNREVISVGVRGQEIDLAVRRSVEALEGHARDAPAKRRSQEASHARARGSTGAFPIRGRNRPFADQPVQVERGPIPQGRLEWSALAANEDRLANGRSESSFDRCRQKPGGSESPIPRLGVGYLEDVSCIARDWLRHDLFIAAARDRGLSRVALDAMLGRRPRSHRRSGSRSRRLRAVRRSVLPCRSRAPSARPRRSRSPRK
jgi:hypothetical protein